MSIPAVVMSLFVSLMSGVVHAASSKAEVLAQEYERLKAYTSTAVPDSFVGGLMHAKKMQGYEILWDSKDFEVDGHDCIRLFKKQAPLRPDFAVTYYKSKFIFPERVVIRRFVGPDGKGWRAETIDLLTGEDLGPQGVVRKLTEEEASILNEWGITVFQ